MKDQQILIKNATIVTQNERREIIKGNIAIKKGRIDYIGNEEPDTEATIDATNKIVIPGFINTHCHVAMTHMRGKLDDIKLSEFLERTFKMDAERSKEGLYNSSLLGAFEMINSGITSFLDLYYSEDVIAKAVQESGIRGFLAWNTLDSDKTTQKGDPLSNAEHFIKSMKDMDRVYPSIGVQGVYVASDEVYLKAKDISERYNTIIHGHLSETREEVYNFTKTHNGERPAEHLDKIGFLNDRFIAAHCVWLTLREAKELGKNKVGVSWNSISNEFLGTGGIPPIPELRDNGAIISLGTDSSASNNALDPFQAMKFSALSLKNDRWDPSVVKAQDVFDMANINAAKSLRMPDLGSIEVGKLADLVLLDRHNPKIFGLSDSEIISGIVYSADSSCVSDVIVDGKIIKNDFRLLNFDPEYFMGKEFV